MIKNSSVVNITYSIIGAIYLSSFDYFLQNTVSGIGWMVLTAFILMASIVHCYQQSFKVIFGIELIYVSINVIILFALVFNFFMFPPLNISDILFPFLHLMYLYLLILWGRNNRKYLYFMVVFSLFILLFSVFLDYIEPLNNYRSAGFTGNPNDSAMGLVICSLGLIIVTKSYNQLTAFIGCLLITSLIGVILTGSRAGLISMVLIFIPLLMQLVSLKSRNTLLGLFLISSFFLLFNFIELPDDLLNRISINNQKNLIDNDSSRGDILPVYLDIIANNLGGIGMQENSKLPVNAHNSIINFTAIFGIFAGALFVIQNLILLFSTYRIYKKFSFALISIIVVILFTANNVFYKREWLFLTLFIFIYYKDNYVNQVQRRK